MDRTGRRRAFTLIEMLTVIAIIMLVMAMALPNFIQMMKGRKWSAAISNIQGMVMRARALATNARTYQTDPANFASVDFSVEFYVNPNEDNGTTMWLESEVNDIERVPDLWDLQHEIGGAASIRYFLNTFRAAGGSYKSSITECTCCVCGHQWSYTSGSWQKCPACGKSGWRYAHEHASYYYDFQYNPEDAWESSMGDNAKQSEYVELGSGITIALAKCRFFLNWDAKEAVECYGYDTTRDIRVGVNGALVQSQDPLIVLKEKREPNYRAIQIVKCTGRVIPADVP